MAVNGGDTVTALGHALRGLRQAVVPELRQVDVADRTGISQARLSRIERGQSLPTEGEVGVLARMYGASPDRVEELVELAGELAAGIRDVRLVVQRGNTLALQQMWRRIEGDATVVHAYNPAMILGVLQTPAYAAIATRTPPDSPAVRDRMLRHRRLLDEPRRRHRLIQTEGSLRQRVGAADVMRHQVDAILDAAEAPNVDIGVIAADQPLDVLVHNAFHLYDRSGVAVGLEVAAAWLGDPDDVDHFRELWEHLWKLCVHDREAVELIRSTRP